MKWSTLESSPQTMVQEGDALLAGGRPSNVRAIIDQLLEQTIIHPEEWDALSGESRGQLESAADSTMLLDRMLDWKLLNVYQVDRIKAGTMRGLVLGNYRVLGSIGRGGSGVIFEAEHLLMRRKVAIKVVPLDPHEQPDLITRFLREMRSVARLDHPNIVAAFDAGVSPRPCPGEPDLYYFVMEHLTGLDLEQHVQRQPLSIQTACTLMYQVACALDEAHQHLLIHRDIKPSNIFVTDSGQAKLLDFGLVRHLSSHAFTSPDHIIGTLDYMAPEQALNASDVDIRTDIFSLGATLFFALTGSSPFLTEGPLFEALQRRAAQQPRSVRSVCSEIPEELDRIVRRMMALHPNDRLQTPQAVMHALLPFLDGGLRPPVQGRETPAPSERPAHGTGYSAMYVPQILIVDHDSIHRKQLSRPLLSHGLECLEAQDVESALRTVRAVPIEVVLVAVDLPGPGGRGLMKAIRDNPPCPNLKIVMMTSRGSADETAALLANGADDYFCLPISNLQMVARVKALVKHKQAQDRTDALNRQLLDLNMELERGVNTQTSDLTKARNALVLALARLVEYRSTETIAHLSRIQRYCTLLAQEAATHANFATLIDPEFIQTIECSAPLHDLGNVGLPDHILLRTGRLEDEERRIMQTHTIIGAETLQHVARHFGADVGFLQMAIDIARHHHEHYDGSGYPDGLVAQEIPLAARMVTIADTYDSLRSRRAQRPGLSHASTLQIMFEASAGKFDPLLLGIFNGCAQQFNRTFRELPDSILFE